MTPSQFTYIAAVSDTTRVVSVLAAAGIFLFLILMLWDQHR